MTRADAIDAQEVMNTEPFTVSADQKLSAVKTRMEEKELRAVAVVSEDDKFEGAIGYRDLIRQLQFNPKSTKLKKVVHNPPHFDEEDNLVDLCDLRINSGRKLLVHTDGDKLNGVVGDKEFLSVFTDVDILENISTDNFGPEELLTVYEDDSLEKARHKMLDNNISRLPVLGDNGKLTGILRSTDLLNAMVSMDSPDAGGTSGNRSGEEINIAGGNEKQKMSSITVDELMDRLVTTSSENLTGKEVADMMIEQETEEVVSVEGKVPHSIITVKDLISQIKDLKTSDTVFVQLIGLDTPEEKEAMHGKIQTSLRGSLGRKLDRPEELSVHIKKAEKDGKKHRYEFTGKLHSEYGTTTAEAEGWDMLEVMDEVLTELNTQIRKKKEKRKDRQKSGDSPL